MNCTNASNFDSEKQKNQPVKSQAFSSSSSVKMTFQDCIQQPSLHIRSPTSRFTRNRVTYSTKRLRSQNVEDLFQSVFQRINSNRTQNIKPSRVTFRQAVQRRREMPDNIVNTLYRQNIKNYNAFIATLQALEEEQGMSTIEKERISKLCHIGAAKEFLKTKKYSEGPKYSRVNVQIRPYMREKMHEEVKFKQQKYENVVFIPTNQLALSFNPNTYPRELEESIPPNQFSSIIQHVNSLIEKEYVSYKSSSMHMFSESYLSKVVLIILAFLTIILFIKPSKELLSVMLAMILLWIFLSIKESSSKLDKLVRSNNVTHTILEKISEFFFTISTEQVEWRVGQDFYWLQIHFIRKKNHIK